MTPHNSTAALGGVPHAWHDSSCQRIYLVCIGSISFTYTASRTLLLLLLLLLQALYPIWYHLDLQVCLVIGGCGLLYFSESETSRRAYALDSVTNARVQPAMMTLASYQWLQFRSDCTLPPLKVFCTRMYNRYNCSPYLHLCAAADSVLLHPTEVWVAEKYVVAASAARLLAIL